ncbi:MAG TPA: MoxR family ATPase [Armatimonadota bacterium]|nr:MoxR family ATPase [Armatimonadota bacterium]HPO71935.1 MoxR family ATPase [Armatimonadota bacterium]HPT96671.1 MoxR family ATPase [Armatimonadota bacterium]
MNHATEPLSDVDLQALAEKTTRIVNEIQTVIIGKAKAVRLAVVTLLCNGHLLIEDIPGVGKTMLGRALARSVGGSFKRVQFTPDLLPADVTGTAIFNPKTAEFEFRPGPVFGNVLLADEVNRATPKTQSSLLECMEEGQVTRDGVTYRLPHPFFVIGTENTTESQGTFPLPLAQLDRFLMRLSLGYPSNEEELLLLERQMKRHPIEDVKPVVTPEEVVTLQEMVTSIHIERALREYVVKLVDATRRHSAIHFGASPRGSLGLMRASQAYAATAGRTYVIPDDIKAVAPAVLTHRISLKPEVRARGITAEGTVEEILRTVPVPVLRR